MYRQIAPLEEQETVINIDYLGKDISIYTNRASVMNRMSKYGYKPSKVSRTQEGKTWGVTYIFPITQVTKFLRSSIFAFHSSTTESKI